VAQIWSSAMMLEHLGEKQAAHAVEQAIFKVLAHSDVRTRDIGGRASTRDVGEVIAAEVFRSGSGAVKPSPLSSRGPSQD
jgi:tartrate dehydrogenase/decarboxylase/D-malate dehydrogenase